MYSKPPVLSIVMRPHSFWCALHLAMGPSTISLATCPWSTDRAIDENQRRPQGIDSATTSKCKYWAHWNPAADRRCSDFPPGTCLLNRAPWMCRLASMALRRAHRPANIQRAMVAPCGILRCHIGLLPVQCDENRKKKTEALIISNNLFGSIRGFVLKKTISEHVEHTSKFAKYEMQIFNEIGNVANESAQIKVFPFEQSQLNRHFHRHR